MSSMAKVNRKSEDKPHSQVGAWDTKVAAGQWTTSACGPRESQLFSLALHLAQGQCTQMKKAKEKETEGVRGAPEKAATGKEMK